MTPNPFTKQYLMTAGPTPIPPAVSQAMAAPMIYHRAPAFDALYERVLAKLPAVFRTQNDVLAFAASGSGALESATSNLVRASRVGILVSSDPGAGACLLANNMVSGATQGAIRAMDGNGDPTGPELTHAGGDGKMSVIGNLSV